MKHIINIKSLATKDINQILGIVFSLGLDKSIDLENKIVALLFFEPSTRTLLSFQTAIYKLGMKPLILNMDQSSRKKGESELDTVKTVMLYADLLIIRHPDNSFIEKCVEISTVPIINAGSGDDSHPTQALIDLYTILQYHKPPFKIGFVGDLKSSRTIKSLIRLLEKLYKERGLEYYFVPDGELDISDKILDDLDNMYYKRDKIEEIIKEIDILYMTRIQKERVNSRNAECNLKLTENLVNHSKNELIIMHPLPRLDEIPPGIDNNPKAVYFNNVSNSILVRGAILRWSLS